MNMPLEAIPVPLREDGDGGLRVGKSRVQLDRLITAREQGATAEAIVEMYDTLDLADVHAVIAWMLRHPEDVAEYARRRNEEAEVVWRKLEAAGVGHRLTREDLDAMKARKEHSHVSP